MVADHDHRGVGVVTMDYHGVVDMGSNGIRFSITDLSKPATRTMPTIFAERAAISLYDAQNPHGAKDRIPIPEATIKDVVECMVRFNNVCKEFGVPEGNVQVVATEATRTAINSKDFLDRIKEATGWTVRLLTQQEEATIGSEGIAASFSLVKGLVLDLGGGSCQLNWMITGAETIMSKTPVSMPYGAAALTNRLSKEDHQALENELVEAFKKAYETIQLPPELKNRQGQHIWACGGGFRGMGYYLLAKHPIQPYPIPLINGFTVPAQTFTQAISTQALSVTQDEMQDMFRISKRRASQVPAIALVIKALSLAIPNLTQIHFSQGGVREGVLFSKLPVEIRDQDPLLAAVAPYSPPSYNALLSAAKDAMPSFTPSVILSRILPSLVSLSYLHARLPKEVASIAALHSMTIGQLAAAPGITHDVRAGIALGLCARWGSEIADREEMARYEELAGDLAYWCIYCGRVLSVLGVVYPTGRIYEEKVWFEVGRGKEWAVVIKLKDQAMPVMSVIGGFGKRIKSILGKEKWKGLKYEVLVEDI